jgi:hypothetical protein
MHAIRRKVGRTYYVCKVYREDGACRNGQGLREDALDAAVIAAFRKVLTPDLIKDVVTEAQALLKVDTAGQSAARADLDRESVCPVPGLDAETIGCSLHCVRASAAPFSVLGLLVVGHLWYPIADRLHRTVPFRGQICPQSCQCQ